MALDLKAWLLENGVKPDAIDAVLPALAPAADNIERSTLRQSDYSTKMNALTAKQTELDSANERLNAEMLEFADARAAGEPITEKMRADMAKAEGEVTRLRTIITTKAGELGLDAKTIIGDVPAARTEPPATTVDLTGYAKSEDMNARLGRFANYMMMLPAELQDISNEHFDLTGKRLSTKAIMEEVKRRAEDKRNFDANGNALKPIDARAIWEEQQGIPALRTTKAEESRVAEQRAAEERGYERAMTERQLPGHEAPGRHSLVLKRKEGDAPHLQRGTPVQQEDRIGRAAGALRARTYAKKAS